jgi:hypothetical protein
MREAGQAESANVRVPDFIIAGAMKCGTTSMHSILHSHPDVFIPRGEIHFFDIDDLIQHPDFFFFGDDGWRYPSLTKRRDEYWQWYSRFFAAAREGQLLGEDSTCYLASERAPERIAEVGKAIKIIIMLRDPADRTYSHYWHLVRTGRAVWSFEETLQLDPALILQRSLYEAQVRNYLRFIPRERLHVVVFEEFVRDIPGTVTKVCEFLGIDASLIDFSKANTHSNAARWPKYPKLQLHRNRALRDRAKGQYSRHLIDVPDGARTASLMTRLADRVHSTFNVSAPGNAKVKMRSETRVMLDEYLAAQNAGLSKLLALDVDGQWYRSRDGGSKG